MKNSLYISFLFCCFSVSFSFAQVSGDLEGQITDHQGKNAAFASLALYRNNTLISGHICDSSGYYTIRGLDTGIYVVKVNYRVYQELSRKVVVKDGMITFSSFRMPGKTTQPTPTDPVEMYTNSRRSTHICRPAHPDQPPPDRTRIYSDLFYFSIINP